MSINLSLCPLSSFMHIINVFSPLLLLVSLSLSLSQCLSFSVVFTFVSLTLTLHFSAFTSRKLAYLSITSQ